MSVGNLWTHPDIDLQPIYTSPIGSHLSTLEINLLPSVAQPDLEDHHSQRLEET